MVDEPPPRYPLEVARTIFPPVWVLYERPDDFPDAYLVRAWYGLTPDNRGQVCASLDEAREYIRACGGCVPLDRADSDPPSVLEAWL
jgi:hypothetical protein